MTIEDVILRPAAVKAHVLRQIGEWDHEQLIRRDLELPA